MKKQNEDITLTPLNRVDFRDDEQKLGSIILTKDEKLLLSKFLDTPTWDVIMKVWRKQRMMQLAVTSINTAGSHEALIGFQGQLKELDIIEKSLRKIVVDFNKSEKAESKSDEKGEQPSPAGARELISKVK